jgi:hypothetical protein
MRQGIFGSKGKGLFMSGARTLLFSQRNLRPQLARCCGYEFEDTIYEIDAVEVCCPPYRTPMGKYAEKFVRRLSYLVGGNIRVNPGVVIGTVEKDYDLFIAICQFSSDLFVLNSLRDWQRNCAVSVCLVEEIWAYEIVRCPKRQQILKSFDYVFVNCQSSVSSLRSVIDRPCEYFPPGVDCMRFSPYPTQPRRAIDLCNLGRRSAVTHAALLEYARLNDFFYIYDTLDSKDRVKDAAEHRMLLGNLMKRSRYFIANKAKINRPGDTGGQDELGFRFFEGAAGGAVLLGDPPQGPAFDQYFGWTDSVISIPFDAPDIIETIKDLDKQTQRVEAVRRENIRNCLLRHDWVYRWEQILTAVDMSLTEAGTERKRKLGEMAEAFESESL